MLIDRCCGNNNYGLTTKFQFDFPQDDLHFQRHVVQHQLPYFHNLIAPEFGRHYCVIGVNLSIFWFSYISYTKPSHQAARNKTRANQQEEEENL